MGICHGCIGGKAISGHNHFGRGIVGHSLHIFRLYEFCQADQEQAVLAHFVDRLAVDVQLLHRIGQRDTQFEHHFIHHIQVGTLWLDPAHHLVHPLHQFVCVSIRNRGGVPESHIGGVQLEHFEADVKGSLLSIHTELAILISGQLLSGAADSLFANLTDVFIPGLVSLTLFVADFGQLHQNKPAVAAVLSVELHHGVSSGCRAREEVKNHIIFFCDLTDKLLGNLCGFREIKPISIQQRPNFFCCRIRKDSQIKNRRKARQIIR